MTTGFMPQKFVVDGEGPLHGQRRHGGPRGHRRRRQRVLDAGVRGANCSDWTSTEGTGAVGFDVVLNAQWLTGGQVACAMVKPFICAEQ